MATLKQKKIVKKISENLGSNNPKPMGALMIESGFKKSVAKTPIRVLQSKGVKSLLLKAGITETKLIEEWRELALHKKPKNKFSYEMKIKALDKLTEIAGIGGKEKQAKVIAIKNFIQNYLQEEPEKRSIE